jgi:hypothetical protein
MGMGLGQILNPSRVMGFFVGNIYIRGHGFGMAKPSGFKPIAIPIGELFSVAAAFSVAIWSMDQNVLQPFLRGCFVI